MMEFSGTIVSTANPDTLLSALHDRRILRRAIPRCRQVVALDGGDFRIRLSLKVAAMEIPITVRLRISHIGDAAVCLAVSGEGVVNSFSVTADMACDGCRDGTSVKYHGIVKLGSFLKALVEQKVRARADFYLREFFRRIDAMALVAPSALI